VTLAVARAALEATVNAKLPAAVREAVAKAALQGNRTAGWVLNQPVALR